MRPQSRKWRSACVSAAAAVAAEVGEPLCLRIGVHSGPLIAGVIGTHKFAYDVWGDTVNTASRMEQYGVPGRIHLSATTRALLGDRFRFEPRGDIDVKGKGKIETFFLEPIDRGAGCGSATDQGNTASTKTATSGRSRTSPPVMRCGWGSKCSSALACTTTARKSELKRFVRAVAGYTLPQP